MAGYPESSEDRTLLFSIPSRLPIPLAAERMEGGRRKETKEERRRAGHPEATLGLTDLSCFSFREVNDREPTFAIYSRLAHGPQSSDRELLCHRIFAEFIYYLEHFCGILRISTYELMSHVNIDNSTSIFHILNVGDLCINSTYFLICLC